MNDSTPNAPVSVPLEILPDKDPGLAATLGLMAPGGGQVYNGMIGKGILIFFCSILLAGILVGLILWLYSAFCARDVAMTHHHAYRRQQARLWASVGGRDQ